jgi:ribonucleotide monophosphatase NagD (HAD superfamily)
MGPGPFITALETAARIDAKRTQVCGKPTAEFFQGCLREMRGAEPLEGERNIVIGDDVDADLGDGAVALGLERVLVKTGKYRDGDEKRGAKPPDALHDSFAAWVDSLLSQESGQ